MTPSLPSAHSCTALCTGKNSGKYARVVWKKIPRPVPRVLKLTQGQVCSIPRDFPQATRGLRNSADLYSHHLHVIFTPFSRHFHTFLHQFNLLAKPAFCTSKPPDFHPVKHQTLRIYAVEVKLGSIIVTFLPCPSSPHSNKRTEILWI